MPSCVIPHDIIFATNMVWMIMGVVVGLVLYHLFKQ